MQDDDNDDCLEKNNKTNKQKILSWICLKNKNVLSFFILFSGYYFSIAIHVFFFGLMTSICDQHVDSYSH